MANSEPFDVCIIGGGVVGLAVLRELTMRGARVALVERTPDLVDGASGRNSGIVCTGYDAPEGSLERKLLRAGNQRYQTEWKVSSPC